MKKERTVQSDTSVPDPLNSFAKTIGQRIHNQGDKSKVTAKELLTTLMPVRSQLGCLPLITSLEKCNETKDEAKEILKDDSDRRVDEAIKKVSKEKVEEGAEAEESETQPSVTSTEELELSYDGKWLKKFFEFPLKMAIKEIVSKKPFDPVNYLGFWLLNYRRCEERRQLQLERDNELHYYRSLIEEPASKEEEVSIDRGEEEEEEMRDWNFKYYEAGRLPK